MVLSEESAQGPVLANERVFIHESTIVSNPLIRLLPVKGMCQCAGRGFASAKVIVHRPH